MSYNSGHARQCSLGIVELTTPLLPDSTEISLVSHTEKDLPPLSIGVFDHSDSNDSEIQERAQSWRSKVTGPPALLTMIVLSIAAVVALEIVASHSNSNGGLFFIAPGHSFPVWQSFVCFYLPIILGVIYSITFSWVDLDVKRLEPFFQLSRFEGTTAKRSLLLQYQFDFIATVPFKAAKLRHWTPFVTGLTMMLIFWIVAPLSGSIFTTQTFIDTRNITIATTGRLQSPIDQTKSINANVFNRVYASRWLDAGLPKFTTDNVALLPFTEVGHTSSKEKNGTITGETLSFGTDLACSPATVKLIPDPPADDGLLFVYENGLGCSWAVQQGGAIPVSATEPSVVYYGWWPPGESLLPENNYGRYWFALNSSVIITNSPYDGDYDPTSNPAPRYPKYQCPDQFSNWFLARWTVPLPNATRWPDSRREFEAYNQTTLFCEASYFQQRVSATVTPLDGKVIHVEPLGKKQPLSDELFNTTFFNAFLGNAVETYGQYGPDGISDATDTSTYVSIGGFPVNEKGITTTTLLDITARLKHLGVRPGEDISQYIFAKGTRSIKSFQSSQTLAEAFQRTHRLLFNAAISFVTTKEEANHDIRRGSRTSETQAIVVDSVFKILLQVFLCVSALFTSVILLLSSKRKLLLRKDPASIFDIMESLATLRPVPRQDGSKMGPTNDSSRNKKDLESVRWHLSEKAEPANFGLDELMSKIPVVKHANSRTSSDEDPQKKHPFPVPFQLKNWVGITWVFFHVIAIILFVILKVKMSQSNGLPLPSRSEFVQNLVLSYLPIAFSTFLEPFWVLLSRTRCMLEPFNNLCRGKPQPASSIRARYLSVPPQLVVWRAIKSRHIVLALLCVVSIIANILAVCFSQLFSINQVTISRAISYDATYETKFSGSNSTTHPTYDYAYTLEASLSGSSSQNTPWVKDEFFFVPASSPESSGHKDLVDMTVTTRGFGVNISCSPASAGFTHEGLHYAATFQVWNGSTYQFQGNQVGLVVVSPEYDKGYYDGHIRQAGEADFTVGSCAGCFFAVWLRSNFRTAPENGEAVHFDSEASAIACVVGMQTARFEITVDGKGQVKQEKLIGKLEPFTSEYLADEVDDLFYVSEALEQLFLLRSDRVNVAFHNTTGASDWFNELIVQISGSSAIVDPNAPVPSVDDVVPLVAKVVKLFVPVYLGLNPHWLLPADKLTPRIHGTIRETHQRVFFAPYIFQITVALLSLDLLVAFLVYVRRPRLFLRQLPTTLAAVLSYFSHTQAIEKIMAESYKKEKDKSTSRDVFAYGKFIGTDGQRRVGIEIKPFVVPLKKHSSWKQHRFWKSHMDV